MKIQFGKEKMSYMKEKKIRKKIIFFSKEKMAYLFEVENSFCKREKGTSDVEKSAKKITIWIRLVPSKEVRKHFFETDKS